MARIRDIAKNALRGQGPGTQDCPSRGRGTPVRALRKVFDFESRHGAPPEVVFPLLCPVRERDWIEGWSCEVLHSESGVAEEDCVFATGHDGRSTWVVTRYEPPARIAFCIFAERGVVARLDIRLEAVAGGGSRLRWRRVYTAVGRRGARVVEALDGASVDAKMGDLAERLEHWLAHGEPMRRRRFAH